MDCVCATIICWDSCLIKGELTQNCTIEEHDINLSLDLHISELLVDKVKFEGSTVINSSYERNNILISLSSSVMECLPLSIVIY